MVESSLFLFIPYELGADGLAQVLGAIPANITSLNLSDNWLVSIGPNGLARVEAALHGQGFVRRELVPEWQSNLNQLNQLLCAAWLVAPMEICEMVANWTKSRMYQI